MFVFGGKYNDFSPNWFYNVGTVLIFTMFINIFSPPLVTLGAGVLSWFMRCWDRGCQNAD